MKSICCMPASRVESRYSRNLLAAAMLPALALAAVSPAAYAADPLGDALTGGKAKLELRYRYEGVEQDVLMPGNIQNPSDANASTMRIRLNYATGEWMSTSAFVEMDSIADMGDGHYNSTRNGETTYPVVADPTGTSLNQAFLKYMGLSNTVITGGRQRINLDNQRFVGSVGWRQNEQTMDALQVEFKGIDRLTATYAFVTSVYRIFGPEFTPNPNTGGNAYNIGRLDGETHFVNIKYVLSEKFSVVAYDYLLDFDNQISPTSAWSTDTKGLRLSGKLPVSSLKFGYQLEAAQQEAYKDNTADFDAPYALAEISLGGGEKLKWEVHAGYEKLGEDNNVAFGTPLATLHKFQGWADRFLTTPSVTTTPAPLAAIDTGLIDTYAGFTFNLSGYGLTVVAHEYESDANGFDFGNELNVQLAKTFAKRYTLTLKHADYAQGDTATGNWFTDVVKTWVMAEAKF